jgi:hypothetical protein
LNLILSLRRHLPLASCRIHRYIQRMAQSPSRPSIRSKVSEARDQRGFFFEIWQSDGGDESRVCIQISRTYATRVEARAAHDIALPLYSAKWAPDA